MIEETLIQYLNSRLEAPAYAERPKEAPEAYYIVERTGGGETDHIMHATVAIQSIIRRKPGNSVLAAIKLNSTLRDAMLGSDGGLTACESIAGVSLNSDYNFTDPETDEYRYQAVYEIYHY